MSDTASVCSKTSTLSKTNQKMSCPFCTDEVQARYMFNHIKSRHPREYIEKMDIYSIEQLEKLIENCEPITFEWTTKNDFDEEETTDIYACLGCNTGMTDLNNAIKHCNDIDSRKKIKCKAGHLKELKALRTAITKKLNEKKNKKEAIKAQREAKLAKYTIADWIKVIKINAGYYSHIYELYSELYDIADENGFSIYESILPKDSIPRHELTEEKMSSIEMIKKHIYSYTIYIGCLIEKYEQLRDVLYHIDSSWDERRYYNCSVYHPSGTLMPFNYLPFDPINYEDNKEHYSAEWNELI